MSVTLITLITLLPPLWSVPQLVYRSGAKYCTTLVIAPANISEQNDVFAWFIVPLIAIGRF
jgi:hypothetical protein